MKPWIKYVGSAVGGSFAIAIPIILSTPFSAAKKNGQSYFDAVAVTAGQFANVVGSWVSSSWVFIPALLIIGGLTTFRVMRRFNKFNAGQKWWVGLQRISIRRAACALANNLPESEFDNSPHAQALAEDILSLVNHGHMPLADERATLANIGAVVGAVSGTEPNNIGPYGKKNRTVNAMISFSTLNSFAKGRRLSLPWKMPVAQPQPAGQRATP